MAQRKGNFVIITTKNLPQALDVWARLYVQTDAFDTEKRKKIFSLDSLQKRGSFKRKRIASFIIKRGREV